MQKFVGAILISVTCLVPVSSFSQVVIHRLGTLGGSSVIAYDLNNVGQVAGNGFTEGDQQQHVAVFQSGVATDLLTLGGSSASAFALNDQGVVVGQSSTADNLATHAFVFANGQMVDLGTLGGTISFAVDVNAAGQVVGDSYVTGNRFQHAFLFSGGMLVDLGSLGGGYSSAVALNDQGLVAGESSLANNAGTHAFVHDGTTMVDLGTLGGNYSTARAVNQSGWVAGESSVPFEAEQHAFLFDGNSMLDLGTLGGSWSGAYAMNDVGWVGGDSMTLFDVEYHGFVYGAGTLVDLGTLGGDYSSVWDMNNLGQVVGETTDGDGQLRAFLWQEGVMTDLNALLPPNSGWELYSAMLVNDAGDVAGVGLYQGQYDWFVLNLGQGQVNQPPVADAGPDLVVECAGGLTSVVLQGGGSQDPDGDTLNYAWTEGGAAVGSGVTPTVALANGTHVLTLTVTDPDGAMSQDTVVVTVQDTTAPVVSCTSVGPLPADDTCSAVLPDLRANTVLSDACSSVAALVLVQDPAPGTVLGEGVHSVTVTATDQAGNQASCSVSVEVVDVQAPVVTAVTATPDALSPPNKTLMPVTVTVTATDACDPQPTAHLVEVLENGVDAGSDAVITGPLSVDLRAVSSNKSNSVVYTLVVECTDAAGNSVRASVDVPVSPAGNGKGKKGKL